MKHWKMIFLFFSATCLCAGEKDFGAVVDFATCITHSKYGKKEQESFEKLQKQMAAVVQDTEKQLKDIASKLEDSDYLDTLSPQAEEELKVKYQSLVEDMNRHQNEFYQTLSQTNYIIQQKMQMNVSKAAEKIATQKKLPFVISKDACFYFNPSMEITQEVLDQMDKNFELESISNNLSESEQEAPKTIESIQ